MKIKLSKVQREVLSMIINDYLYTGYAYVDKNHEMFIDLESKGLIKIIFQYYSEPSELLKESLLVCGIDLYEMTDVRILSRLPIHEEQLEMRKNYVVYNTKRSKGFSDDKDKALRQLYLEAEQNDCTEKHFEELYYKNGENKLPITVKDIPETIEIRKYL